MAVSGDKDSKTFVFHLPSPRTIKIVTTSLNGKLAGLNRFLSKSADKSLPLFKTLKKCTKKGDFRWTTEAEEVSRSSSSILPHSPLVAPLLTRGDKSTLETEPQTIRAMEMLILALVCADKRLREISKRTNSGDQDQPIKQVISKPDASGRLQKWSVLLGEHNISYRPRTAVKGQILADFLIEKPETDAVLPQSEVKLQEPWILFTDGSSCVDGSGAGLILTNPEGMEFTYALRFEFTATNNEAEYEALIAGLRIAARMGVRNLEANVDSRLVANHVLGEYVAKEDNMIQYLDKTKSLIQGFDRFTIRQKLPREQIPSRRWKISAVIEEQGSYGGDPSIIEFLSRHAPSRTKGSLDEYAAHGRRDVRTPEWLSSYRRSVPTTMARCVRT
ncbi:reverse transcriptase domain-containing protein [Tanacetum coccineum]